MCKKYAIVVVFLSLLSGFFLTDFAQAQNETIFQTVNTEQLKGHRNSGNSEDRARFYHEELRRLDEKYKQQKPKDTESVLVEDFSFAIDEALGSDFPKGKKKLLQTYQYNMLKQKSVLDKLYERGILDKNTYVEQASNVVEESFNHAAEILTHEEYEILFGMEKGNINGIFYRLLNVSLPDSEKFIDVRENSKQK